jgi:hypothetical protein
VADRGWPAGVAVRAESAAAGETALAPTLTGHDETG